VSPTLHIQVALGPPLLATSGYSAPEVERAFSRAYELCQQVGDPAQLFRVLWGLGRFYLVRPQLQTARTIGEQMLAMAQRAGDENLLLEAHNSLGAFLFHLGDPVAAREHLERGSALYDGRQHAEHSLTYGQDPGVVCLIRAAWALWILGYPDQAVERSRAAVALAREVAHPFSLAFALAYAATLHKFLRDAGAAQRFADEAAPLSATYNFPPFRAMAGFVRSWAIIETVSPAESIAEMRRELSAFRATGAELGVPYFLGTLAEAHGAAGQTAEGSPQSPTRWKLWSGLRIAGAPPSCTGSTASFSCSRMRRRPKRGYAAPLTSRGCSRPARGSCEQR
jgi:predicted ATPase